MLIDDFLPAWHFRERHAIRVGAPAGLVFEALGRTDFSRSPLVRSLLRLRGFREIRGRYGRPLTLGAFVERGFVPLGEVPGREIALGVAGRFWTPRGDLRRLDAEGFRRLSGPGLAKAVWTFSVEEVPGEPAASRLATETRIRCLDGPSRRRFRLYWALVRPFSGLLRREMLRAARREAEAVAERDRPGGAAYRERPP